MSRAGLLGRGRPASQICRTLAVDERQPPHVALHLGPVPRSRHVGDDGTGSFDPTDYVYSAATGRLQTVRYHDGSNERTVSYSYDGDGRVTALSDWLGANILSYAYDSAGRGNDQQLRAV